MPLTFLEEIPQLDILSAKRNQLTIIHGAKLGKIVTIKIQYLSK